MAIIEAMACGLPIVATDSGSIGEVLGDAGIVVREKDVRAMSQEIFDLLNNSKRGSNLGNLAIERTKNIYDSKKVSSQIAKLYV